MNDIKPVQLHRKHSDELRVQEVTYKNNSQRKKMNLQLEKCGKKSHDRKKAESLNFSLVVIFSMMKFKLE
jgi:hypothetical protein